VWLALRAKRTLRLTRARGVLPASKFFEAAKVNVTESDGRAVDAKTLAERLKSMTTVLVATNGKNPTAAHLQAVKPGTLVLTVQTTHLTDP
jgi:hypothetical protein